jgi:hypothetical protein
MARRVRSRAAHVLVALPAGCRAVTRLLDQGRARARVPPHAATLLPSRAHRALARRAAAAPRLCRTGAQHQPRRRHRRARQRTRATAVWPASTAKRSLSQRAPRRLAASAGVSQLSDCRLAYGFRPARLETRATASWDVCALPRASCRIGISRALLSALFS